MFGANAYGWPYLGQAYAGTTTPAGTTYTKAGTGISDFDGSGAKAIVRAKAGTGISDFDGSGAKAIVRAKAGTGISDFDGSGAKPGTNVPAAAPPQQGGSGSHHEPEPRIAVENDIALAMILALVD